jgi:integrase
VKDLRSTYGSKLVQNGAPIFTVSKLLGHSSVTVTEKHYAALSDEGKREAVNTLSKIPKEIRLQLLETADNKSG